MGGGVPSEASYGSKELHDFFRIYGVRRCDLRWHEGEWPLEPTSLRHQQLELSRAHAGGKSTYEQQCGGIARVPEQALSQGACRHVAVHLSNPEGG